MKQKSPKGFAVDSFEINDKNLCSLICRCHHCLTSRQIFADKHKMFHSHQVERNAQVTSPTHLWAPVRLIKCSSGCTMWTYRCLCTAVTNSLEWIRKDKLFLPYGFESAPPRNCWLWHKMSNGFWDKRDSMLDLNKGIYLLLLIVHKVHWIDLCVRANSLQFRTFKI